MEIAPTNKTLSWIFTSEFIRTGTPSRLDGISYSAELNERQKCANLIQDIAQRNGL
jgi:hypothetical protein